MATQAIPIPAFSAVERPDEEDGVEEDEEPEPESEPEPEPELEPVEGEELAWPNAPDEAAVAGLVSFCDRKMHSDRGELPTFGACYQ